MVKRCLILFSGTRSFEKVIEKMENVEVRGLDLDNHFKPFYNVDILKFDYKKELKDWIPHYIHSSPICKNYTPLKNSERKNKPNKEDLEFSLSLVSKTLEIINYVLSLNPNLKFTIENPKGYMRTLEIMKPFNRVTTSYCKYFFNYRKDTDFWCNFDLKLKSPCRKNKKQGDIRCESVKDNNGIHPVRIGYIGSYDVKTKTKKYYDNQIIDCKYFSLLRKNNSVYKGFTDTYFRYRIPQGLIEEIVKQVI